MIGGNFPLLNASTSSFGFGKQPKKLTVKNFKPPAVDYHQYEQECWPQFQAAITSIFNGEPITGSLEELHQMCQNLCIFSLESRLYSMITGEIEKHMLKLRDDILMNAKTLYPLGFLESFIQTWSVLVKNVKLLQKIFIFLDRSWAMQTAGILTIWDFVIAQVKQQIILGSGEIKTKIISSLLDFVQRERLGASLNRTIVKQFISIFIELNLYDELFEQPFLESSHQYYDELLKDKFSSQSISVFIDFVILTIEEESKRIDDCCSPKTKKPLLTIVESLGLVRNVGLIFSQGFPELFEAFNVESLGKLYELMERIQQLDSLRASLSSVIKLKGTCIVERMQDSDDISIIKDLIMFKRKNSHLLVKSFKNNDSFSNSIKDSFEDFLNTNQHKPAELLAKYFDSVLKNSLSSDQTSSIGNDSEAIINELMQIFRYIHGKDVFEAFYKKDLAKRLLLYKGISVEMENLVLSKLKAECGLVFTSKLEGMFKDISLSKELIQSFNQSNGNFHDSGDVEFTINVLTSGFWPSYPDSPVNLPDNIESFRQSFSDFYCKKYSGRQLKWQNSLSNCVIKATFPKGTKELVVSAHQAAVLLLFNERNSLSYAEIQKFTGMNETELQKALLSLSCSKVRILVKEPKTAEISGTDQFSYNEDFIAKLFRLKINTVQLKETPEEIVAVTTKVLEDRHILVNF